MASKGKKKSGSKKRKAGNGGSESGHNIRITKEAVQNFAKRYNNLMDERQDELDKYKEDTTALVAEMADTFGVSKKNARKSLKEQRAERAREEAERQMEPDELKDLDTLRYKLGLYSDTPLGRAAIDKVSGVETPAEAPKADE